MQDTDSRQKQNSSIGLHEIFSGPEGLRAGWGLLLFVAMWLAFGMLLHPLLRSLLPHAAEATQPMSPIFMIAAEANSLACVALSTWVMARIEGHRFRDFGLGDSRSSRHLFAGAVWGAALLSILVLALRAAGALAFDARLLSGARAVEYAGVWLLAFFIVALFEELLFRGYPLHALNRGIQGMCNQLGLQHSAGIAFWISALLTSCVFGLVHRSNSGESTIGLFAAGLIGLVFCFSIWRTGSLWWAIGFHATWDWMESFFYGVGNSGTVIRGQLMASHPIGRTAISGGLTGPEGSVLVLPVVALSACVVLFSLRSNAPYGRASGSTDKSPPTLALD